MEPAFDSRATGALLGQPGAPSRSATSWSAIIAGAVVATAVSVVLLALGSGLGFAASSPWPGAGVSLGSFAVTTAIWLIVMQWLASGAGGHIAGRLGTRWIGTHTHEVLFRDTAHGFVTWAVANVLVTVVIVAAFAAAVSGGVRTASTVAAGSAGGLEPAATPAYVYGLDRLLRPAMPTAAPAPGAAEVRAQITHIMAQALNSTRVVSGDDRTYLAGLVVARTGVAADEAQGRVHEFIATANQAAARVRRSADAARQAAARGALLLALALTIGAFIACLSAALGEKRRDEQP